MTISKDEQTRLYRYYTEPKMVTDLTRRTLALVLAGGEGSRLMDLTAWRAKPAVPMAASTASLTLRCRTASTRASAASACSRNTSRIH